MDRIFFIISGILGATGVALGAFGAHGLRSRLTPERLETFETGVRYQMYHALVLLATAWAARSFPASPLPGISGWLFLAGVLLFSGSLYLLVFTGKHWWGAITPVGGVAFIAGWLCLAAAAL
ncbi:MAG TPA: DUF423 domain-containing protein [Anaerolineales bacterium]